MASTGDTVIKLKHKLIGWGEVWKKAFSEPTDTGLIFIWGYSGSGKTGLWLQLVKELIRKKMKVYVDSLEEGTGPTLQKMLVLFGMGGLGRYLMIGEKTLEELDEYLTNGRAPHVIVIDSIQMMDARTDQVKAFIKKHKKNHLLIIISQVEGKKPLGKQALAALYLADLKLWVEGHKAISHGRYNKGGEFIIWAEAAVKYWGTQLITKK